MVGLREVPTTRSLQAIELEQPVPFLGEKQKGHTHRASDFGNYLGTRSSEVRGWGRSQGGTHLCKSLDSLLLLPAQSPALGRHLLAQRPELFLQDLDAALQGTPILVTSLSGQDSRLPSHDALCPHPHPRYLKNWGGRAVTKPRGQSFSFWR